MDEAKWNKVFGTNKAHFHDASNDYSNIDGGPFNITAEFSYNAVDNPSEESLHGCLCCSIHGPWYEFYKGNFSGSGSSLSGWGNTGTNIT